MSMPPAPSLLQAELPPLRMDDGGVIRVGATRIALDRLVELFQSGMTPEDMVRAHETLDLADVYGAIAFVLRHQTQVQEYLRRRTDEGTALRTKIENESARLTRDELLARRNAQETSHASVSR